MDGSQRPRETADLDGFYGFQRGDIDHRNVPGNAVGGEKLRMVGREGEMPDTSADEDVFLHFEGFRIDHRHMVGRAKRDEGCLAVGRELEADRLDQVGVDARDLETNLRLFA